MNIYTQDLVKLSKIDKELQSYDPEIKKIDNKIRVAEDKVSSLQTKVDSILEQIDSNKIQITSFETQIKEVKKSLEDAKKKAAIAKNEKEINAASTEEHIAKDTLQYNNEQIDRLNKINEVKEEELKELSQSLEAAKKELEEIKESVESDYKAIEESKASLYKQRDEQIRSMDSKILAFYEKIKNWAGNTAVVKVENQACYGCYMKINDKTYSDLILGEEIVTCPHCGRVLYLELDKERAEA